ncbi:MAG: hypothetical protein KatS3mg034_1106 [Vicingaceae bacterium]|nr:MAG: hypothetical protein KatS3mg028_1644 [Bacteroidia bacterium]GIV41796.1 MAG: hypothetical protein KatS3mg034_1106 [Vicingaceae bacterium]
MKFQVYLNYALKKQLENFPALYISLLRWKYRNHWFKKRIINENTDIVIEGFPRSANSFFVKAFALAQNHQVNIATHVHSHVHVLEAIKRQKPVVVLIRHPDEAIVSLKALFIESAGKGNNSYPQMPIHLMMDWYIRFYSGLLPYKSKFVLAKFDDVTSNIDIVIENINKKFNTAFHPFGHTKENEFKIIENARFHLAPSELRNKIKMQVKNEYFDKNNKKLRELALQTYLEMTHE